MGLANLRRLKAQRGGSDQTRQLLKRQAGLEEAAALTSGGVPEPRGPGVLGRIVDILSRPNFAIAGAAEEAFAPQGGGLGAAPGRALREFFSGVGGLQGDKEGFGLVLEQAGVGTGGQLSNLAPFLFSESGKGPALQRGGLFDITPRGTAGLALDIATDPLTFVGAGGAGRLTKFGRTALREESRRVSQSFIERATRMTSQKAVAIEQRAEAVADRLARVRIANRVAAGEAGLVSPGGIRFAGQTLVAGQAIARPARFAQRKLTGVLESSSPGRFVLETGRTFSDAVDRMFHRDPRRLRNIPGAVRLKQQSIDLIAAGHHELREGIRKTYGSIPVKVKTAILRHVDDPERFPITTIPEEFHGAIQKVKTQTVEWFQMENKRGLIRDQAFRKNYIPHFFENSAEQVRQIEVLRNKNIAPPTTSLGRHVEARTFKTIQDAVDFSKRAKAAGKIKFELRPITDLDQVLWLRGRAHVSAITGDDFLKKLRFKFGRKTAQGAIDNIEDTLPGVMRFLRESTGVDVSPANIKRFSDVLDNQQFTVEQVRKMSPEIRAAFVQAKFAKVRSIAELREVMERIKPVLDDIDPKLLERVREFTDTSTMRTSVSPWGEEYVKLPKDLSIRQLAGWELPRPIMEDVANFHRTFINKKEAAAFIRTFDALNNTFKMAVTTMFPAFHFRNAYSNVSQSFTDIGLQALNPKLHVDAIGVMAGREGTFQSLTRRYTYDELRQVARRKGILIDASHLAEIVGPNDKLRRNIITAPGRKVGRGIENEARLQLFMGHLRRGLSADDAADRVKKFIFDYNNISPFEREVLSRMIPFYRWTRKNIALQAENLIKRPGRLATQIKPFRETGPEADLLPDYLKGDLKIKVQAGPGNAAFVTGIDLPIGDLNRIFTGDWGETVRQNLSMISPLLKAPVEFALGTELFTGREFSGQLNTIGPVIEKAPKPIREYLEFNKRIGQEGQTIYNMNPTKAYLLFKSYALSRFFTSVERLGKRDATVGAWAVDMLTGVRLKEFDLTEAQERQIKNRISQLERTLVNRGQFGKFERAFPFKESK